MVLIPLHNRADEVVGHALVDDEDAYLAEFRWSLNRRHGRAYRKVAGQNIYMQRAILGLEFGDSRQGDHINRDRLDNRRSNLRIATPAQNSQNISSQRGASSRFRGVSWDKARDKWAVYVKLGGLRRNLGRFADEEEAAAVASRWRAEHMPFAVEDLT